MFKLIIETDNATFTDDDNAGATEIARMLRDLAAKLEDGIGRRTEGGSLFDQNGNRVGSWEWPR